MAGIIWYAQGKWRCKAGSYTSPVITLNEDDLRGSLQIQTRASRRDNFNRLLRKFGPEQIEELDLLEKSFPDLFEGDYSIVEQNVDNYIMSKTAPRITPTGSIFVAAEGGTAEKELDRTYDTSLIGVDRLNKNISDLNQQAAAGLAQYQGMNTADLFTSEFTKAGTRAEGVATRREAGTDKQTIEQ
jgi:hypothetical protein